MALIDKTSPPQPVRGSSPLPSAYPKTPADVLRRFPSMVGFDREVAEHHRRLRSSLYSTLDELGVSASKTDTKVGAVESLVSVESRSRRQSDGYLEGYYALRVTAGNVVTGMKITSASGPGTEISDVTFAAANFRIFNGLTGVQTFAVDGLGNVSLAGTITLSSLQVSGLGALALLNSVAYGDISGSKPPVNADVTLAAINGGLAITGGGLQLLSGGAALRGGQTAYDTGLGFWLGDAAGTTKFSIGNSGGNKLTWNGSALTMVGTVTATSGNIAGFTLGANGFTSGAGATYFNINTDATAGLTMGDASGDQVRLFTGVGTAQACIYDAGSLAAEMKKGQLSLFSFAGDTRIYSSSLGIVFSSDTNIYRTAANHLKTDDAFTAVGVITAASFNTVP
jgi:hypothetical protein